MKNVSRVQFISPPILSPKAEVTAPRTITVKKTSVHSMAATCVGLQLSEDGRAVHMHTHDKRHIIIPIENVAFYELEEDAVAVAPPPAPVEETKKTKKVKAA